MEDLKKEIEDAVVNLDATELVRIVKMQKGKKMIIDVASLPVKHMTLDQWLWFYKELNIAWVDSRESKFKPNHSKTLM